MPPTEKKEIKKFAGTQDQWDKMAAKLQASMAPDVYACKKCGYPVIEGYCCAYCGNDNPSVK